MWRRLVYLWLVAGGGWLAAPQPLLAHDNELPGVHDLWRMWNWHPLLVLGLGMAGWFYSQGVGALWRQAGMGHGITRGQALAFNGGLLALFVALVSPLDRLSAQLFSAHMVQHLLLIVVAAPLLVWGEPLLAFFWALPRGKRRPLSWWWRRQTHLPILWRGLAHPMVAWGGQALVLWLWHVPAVYEAALSDPVLHVVQHGCLLASALLFWWIVLPERTGRNLGQGIALLFTTALHTGMLGALITFATTPWYGTYGENTLTWGLTPLEDQQLAGIIMWAPMGLVYLLATLGLLARGLKSGERLEREEMEVKGDVMGKGRQSLPLMGSVLALLILSGCATERAERLFAATGDPEQGKVALRAYGCNGCHTIPGVAQADALVGPPLDDWADRHYIAGSLANTPENLVQWIRYPQAIEPGTAMPNLGVTEADAYAMSAYLYTLRRNQPWYQKLYREWWE